MWILPFCCHASAVFLVLSPHHLYRWMPPVWIHSNTETAFLLMLTSRSGAGKGAETGGNWTEVGKSPWGGKIWAKWEWVHEFLSFSFKTPSSRTSWGILLLHPLHLPPPACILPSQQPQELACGRSHCSCGKSATASSGKDAARHPRPVPEDCSGSSHLLLFFQTKYAMFPSFP